MASSSGGMPVYATIPPPPATLTTPYATILNPNIQKPPKQPETMSQTAMEIGIKNPSLINGRYKITWHSNEIQESIIQTELQYAIMGKFKYGNPDINELRRVIPLECNIKGEVSIGVLEPRLVLIRCTLKEDYVNLLSSSGYWLKLKNESIHMRTLKWETWYDSKKETPTSMAWISFPNLPPNLFARKFVYSIALAVGKPLHVDMATRNKTRPSCARVKVEVNLLNELPQEIEVGEHNDDGQVLHSRLIKIRYDYLPKYCKTCCLQGHSEDECYSLHPELFAKKQAGQKQAQTMEKDGKSILTSGRITFPENQDNGILKEYNNEWQQGKWSRNRGAQGHAHTTQHKKQNQDIMDDIDRDTGQKRANARPVQNRATVMSAADSQVNVIQSKTQASHGGEERELDELIVHARNDGGLLDEYNVVQHRASPTKTNSVPMVNAFEVLADQDGSADKEGARELTSTEQKVVHDGNAKENIALLKANVTVEGTVLERLNNNAEETRELQTGVDKEALNKGTGSTKEWVIATFFKQTGEEGNQQVETNSSGDNIKRVEGNIVSDQRTDKRKKGDNLQKATSTTNEISHGSTPKHGQHVKIMGDTEIISSLAHSPLIPTAQLELMCKEAKNLIPTSKIKEESCGDVITDSKLIENMELKDAWGYLGRIRIPNRDIQVKTQIIPAGYGSPPGGYLRKPKPKRKMPAPLEQTRVQPTRRSRSKSYIGSTK